MKPDKQSYERSPDVQRWLQSQAEALSGAKPPFEPTLLASRRDRDWILSSLAAFYQQDLITDVLTEVSSGKEATVFCCVAHPATGYEYLAAKVYRPRMFRSLSNDAVYRKSRAVLDERGKTVRDRRGRLAAEAKSERGRMRQVQAWIQHEYKTQQLLSKAGANVPQPVAHIGNAILMEYIGDEGGPAPLLREVSLAPDEAQPFFDCVMQNIELWLACDRIHGDLSAYNILYWNGAVTIIDLAQSVDPRHNPDVYELLARDIERVYAYFARYGVEADPHALTLDLWTKYLGGRLSV